MNEEPMLFIADETDFCADEIPLAAQLPLSTFAHLPPFPPAASHLRSLTLTADIPLPSYQSLLAGGEYTLPVLPPTITHLTLELFSLGFPGRNPKFLGNLADALKALRCVTVFACLLDGLDERSREDAVRFFGGSEGEGEGSGVRGLGEVHVIDSFVRPGFWKEVGKGWERRARAAATTWNGDSDNNGPEPSANGEIRGERGERGSSNTGMQVVDISYTYRGHADSDFLARVHGEELPLLIVPGLVGAGFGFVEEAEGDKDLGSTAEDQNQDQHGGVEDGTAETAKQTPGLAGGILPFASDSRATRALVARFSSAFQPGDLRGLKVLNLTMWTLTVEDLGVVLYAISRQPQQQPQQTTGAAAAGGGGLVDITLSILMMPGWFEALADTLARSEGVLGSLEGLEIVGVPSLTSAKAQARPGDEGKGKGEGGDGMVQRQIDNIMDTGDGKDGAGVVAELLTKEQVEGAFGDRNRWEKLSRVEMSVLKVKRAGVVRFERVGGGAGWTGGRVE